MKKLNELIDLFGKDAIKEIAESKILDLQNPKPRFTALQIEYLNYRLGNTTAKQIIEIQELIKQRKYESELLHWSKLYLRLTDKPESNPNRLTENDIERAREFPTHELYSGRLFRSGRCFKCLCPFHTEKTPSFYFYSDGSYHCFGCQSHGSSAIDYLMKLQNYSFPDAVRRLL